MSGKTGEKVDQLVPMGEAVRLLNRSRKTLLAWEREGKLVPVKRAGGRNERRYRLDDVLTIRDQRLVAVASEVVPGLDADATREEVLGHLRAIVARGRASSERGDWLVAVAAARAVLEFLPAPGAGRGTSVVGGMLPWMEDVTPVVTPASRTGGDA